jgi:hypothetical protein
MRPGFEITHPIPPRLCGCGFELVVVHVAWSKPVVRSVLLLSVRLGIRASLRACPCACDNRLQHALPENSVALKLQSLNSSTRAICEQLELAGCWKGAA